MYNERAWVLEEMHSDNTYYARNTLYGAVDPTENVADFCSSDSQWGHSKRQCASTVSFELPGNCQGKPDPGIDRRGGL